MKTSAYALQMQYGELVSSFPTTSVRFYIQSTLVISKSKGLSETLRDIRTSTYQICRIEEKNI